MWKGSSNAYNSTYRTVYYGMPWNSKFMSSSRGERSEQAQRLNVPTCPTEEGKGHEVDADDDDDERLRLARSVKELTEVVRFGRRDKEVRIPRFMHHAAVVLGCGATHASRPLGPCASR